MAATKQQVNVFMSQRKQGKTQVAAAASAGISERSARRIEREGGRDPDPRHWRTRPDPFAEVWDEVADLLGDEPGLQPLTVLEWLQERYPEHSIRTGCCVRCSGERNSGDSNRNFGRA